MTPEEVAREAEALMASPNWPAFAAWALRAGVPPGLVEHNHSGTLAQQIVRLLRRDVLFIRRAP